MYIGKRILMVIPVALIMTMLVFGLSQLSSGDPARVIAEKIYEHPTRTEVEQVRHEQGLDRSLYQQYLRWLSHVVQGDFGNSYQTEEPAMDELASRMPATLKLAGLAFVLLLAIAVPLGILSAVFQDSWIDRIIQGISFFSVSMPAFWMGLLLLYWFGVKLQIIPVIGGADNGGSSFLAALTLDIGFIGILTRLVRTNLKEILAKGYIRACRAQGISSAKIVLKHGMKNAVLPAVTQIGNMCVMLLSGSAIVESIFSIQGIGNLALESVYTKDLPVLQCFILVVTCLVVLINLAVDLLYSVIDVRIKLN